MKKKNTGKNHRKSSTCRPPTPSRRLQRQGANRWHVARPRATRLLRLELVGRETNGRNSHMVGGFKMF